MKTILVCPLDWGIGHATRCVPVIREFIRQGFHVIIAADGRPLGFLKTEFPELETVVFPGTRITYPKRQRMTFRMAVIAPRFLMGIRKEKQFIRKYLKTRPVDIIVSDNRYGVRNKKITSILITHQCNIQVPSRLSFAGTLINWVNHLLIRKFDACWIPDFELHNGLAGKLSHPPVQGIQTSYLGSFSRFSYDTEPMEDLQAPILDVLVALSGPEPQRSILEEKILRQLETTSLTGIVVRGRTEEDESYDLTPNIRVYSHLETRKLRKAMKVASVILCRSGYSSLMDIVTIGRRAIFVPTPGQTEQEYLARYMMEKKIFLSMNQDTFDLLYALEMSINFPGMVMQNDYRMLVDEIRKLGLT